MESMPKRSHDPNIQMILDELTDAKNNLKLLADDLRTVREKVLVLPCSVHIHKFNEYDNFIKNWRTFVAGSFLAILAFAALWGEMRQNIANHSEVLKACCNMKDTKI
jgi:hypothetical protein